MESTVDPESFVGIQKKKLPSTIEDSFLNLRFLSSNFTVAYNWDHVALIAKKKFCDFLKFAFLGEGHFLRAFVISRSLA